MCSQFCPDAICHPNGDAFCRLASVDIWLIRFYSLSAAAGGKSLLQKVGLGLALSLCPNPSTLSIRLSISTPLTAYLFFNPSPGPPEVFCFRDILSAFVVFIKKKKNRTRLFACKRHTVIWIFQADTVISICPYFLSTFILGYLRQTWCFQTTDSIEYRTFYFIMTILTLFSFKPFGHPD